MEAATNTGPPTQAHWESILDQITQHVQSMLVHVDQSLSVQSDLSIGSERSDHESPIKKLAGRVEGLETRADKAREKILGVDRMLAEHENALRAELRQSESLRHRLAEWVDRSIG